MAEESTKSWADSDSETSSTSSSSSDSEQEEVHCFMADQTDDDEVFDFANSEFTREDLVQALNDMVHEYKTLSHTFEKIKAENASLKNRSAESSSDELENTDSLKTELSRLKIENDVLRNEASELKAEVDKLTEEMSSWNKANRSLYKLYESQKPLNDKTCVGFNYDSSHGETSTQSQSVHDKLNKRVFVSACMIHDCLESMRYNDQNNSQPDRKEKGKVENSIACITIASHAQGEQRCLRQRYNCITNHHGTALLTSFHLIVFKGNRSAYVSIADRDMVDRTQKKAKGFAEQIGVLFKGIPAIPMGDGVRFPSAKVLSMRTVHTYIVTNTTIDARTESEEPGMAKTPKGMKKLSSADEMPVYMFSEFTASKKRSATEADAPIIAKKRRTGKSKPSVSQAKLDIVQVATDVEPIQIVDPTHVEGTAPPLVLRRKSRKRKLVLSRDSDDESVGTEEISKEADAAVAISTVEADIAKVLEETLAFGVTETTQESQVFDEALFEEDFTRWLDDFVARHNEPELGSTHNEAQAAGSIHSVADKEVNMLIDDLLIQICDDLLLPVTAAEVTMLRLGAFSSSGDKGKAKLGEDDQVTDNAARKLFALICRDVEVLVQVRDRLMQAVVDFFASFSLNSMPDMDSLKDLKEKERLMLAWAETTTLAVAVRRQLYVLIKYHELLLRTILESYQRVLNFGVAVATYRYLVWTPAQGPEFWSSSCNLSLFLDNLQMPGPAIQKLFVPLISFIEPDQYWANVPWLMRIWRWTKVCEEVVAFNLSGGLRPVRKDACYAITVHNLGVERIPANFLRLFAQGLASHNFVDSVVREDLGDTEEVVLTGIEEVELASSDVSTLYRSPSPPSPGVDSLEHDLRFALGPAIFSRTEQEERLYFVQSPDSPPAVSPHHESSSSSTDVSLHFDSTDVLVHAQAATHAPASVDSTKLAEILEDLQSSLTQRIHDSNCEMMSKLNSVELGVRGDLLKMQSLLRQSFETACRVLERQSNTHTAQITDLKKGLMGPVGIIFGDLIEIKKKQREQDAKQQSMDEQIAAIRNEHLEFQSKIAADMLSLSTQVGDIADFLRSGVAKKGEMGSSSRPTTGRAQTQTLPPTTGTFEERVAQARRNIIETGQVISIEEAAARVIENDRRESERLERERRDRRQRKFKKDLLPYLDSSTVERRL
ncbi:hypothetical protein F511_12681 [Dorcoceras hygrometricum]|uniref:Uncharacterized protein n=1 Tax=Dorcoceras hygrometricum TaxID=472368 RepID=A0A2Z7DAD6_9LAMI|nr:hypothetical protein F511_12681 [Dorcoceras hygrometricum]